MQSAVWFVKRRAKSVSVPPRHEGRSHTGQPLRCPEDDSRRDSSGKPKPTLRTEQLRTLRNYSQKEAGVWREGERAETHTNCNWAKYFNSQPNLATFPSEKIYKRRESFTEGLVNQTPRGAHFRGGSDEWWESPLVYLDSTGNSSETDDTLRCQNCYFCGNKICCQVFIYWNVSR